MHEMIITHVVPAKGDEPAHTQVYRFEFESAEQVFGVIAEAVEAALDGGLMTN
jgi:hypothetical protein